MAYVANMAWLPYLFPKPEHNSTFLPEMGYYAIRGSLLKMDEQRVWMSLILSVGSVQFTWI